MRRVLVMLVAAAALSAVAPAARAWLGKGDPAPPGGAAAPPPVVVGPGGAPMVAGGNPPPPAPSPVPDPAAPPAGYGAPPPGYAPQPGYPTAGQAPAGMVAAAPPPAQDESIT